MTMDKDYQARCEKWVHKVMARAEDFAYDAGYRCGLEGPNTDNCHFRHFSTPEKKTSWEAGQRDGKAALAAGLTEKGTANE